MRSWDGTLGRFAAGFAVVFVVCVGVVGYLQHERDLLLTTRTLAELRGSAKRAAINLDLLISAYEREVETLALRHAASEEALESALHTVPQLRALCLYAADGRLLVEKRKSEGPSCTKAPSDPWLSAVAESSDGSRLFGYFAPPEAFLTERGTASVFKYTLRRAPSVDDSAKEVSIVLRDGFASTSARIGERPLWVQGEFKVSALIRLFALPFPKVAGAVAVALAVLAFILHRLARGITHPLRAAAAAADAMSSGDFTQRLAVSGPAEVRLLTTAVNGLSARLQKSYEQLVTDVEERSADVVAALDKARALQRLSEDQAAALAEKNRALEEQAEKLRAREQQLAAQNEMLALSNEQLARASRLKSEFLASMSHELRTPLNAVIGFSDLLLAGVPGEVNAEQQEYLGDIHSSGKHLLALINDILDLSKIEAGKMPVAREPLDLRIPSREAEEMVRGLALKKKISLRFEGEEEVVCLGDSQRLRQVVLNLLSNAVKFTPPEGSVTVSVGRDVARGLGVITVRDTGIGISLQDQSVIFEAFRQVEGGHARHFEGTGLGLALVKKFLEAMGGGVEVESAPGEGSTFTVRLPLRPAQTESAQPEGPPRVLVAEDDEANRQLLGKIFAARGLDVTLVENGQQAVDELGRGLPSVVVLDLMMPLLDGYAVLERLRRMPGGQNTGVLVLSARDLSADNKRVLSQAGAELVLKGTLPTEQLVSWVRRLAERPATGRAA